MFETLKELIKLNSISREDIIETFQITSNGISNNCSACQAIDFVNVTLTEVIMKIQVVVQELNSFPNSVGTADEKFMNSALKGTDDIITLLEKLSPNFLSRYNIVKSNPLKFFNRLLTIV